MNKEERREGGEDSGVMKWRGKEVKDVRRRRRKSTNSASHQHTKDRSPEVLCVSQE